jgi:hypothetical protein
MLNGIPKATRVAKTEIGGATAGISVLEKLFMQSQSTVPVLHAVLEFRQRTSDLLSETPLRVISEPGQVPWAKMITV